MARSPSGVQPYQPRAQREEAFRQDNLFPRPEIQGGRRRKLFSNNEPNEYIVRKPYLEVRKDLNQKMIDFLKKYPDPAFIRLSEERA